LKFHATVIPSGNASGVEVPLEVAKALGSEARPPVVVSINGHAWRSRIAVVGGQRLIGIKAADRDAAGIALSQVVEVEIQRDDAPREVAPPPDLAAALNAVPNARAAFDRLPFGLKRKHVADIEAAKSAETRRRRIEKLAQAMGAPSP
jgi:Bacteriocin-protection, YdeI or OmpD-Associated/Domain of unknown function (DUF1905)